MMTASSLRPDDVRYGCYLRPSPAMCWAQAEMHALLARQYNLQAAGLWRETLSWELLHSWTLG